MRFPHLAICAALPLLVTGCGPEGPSNADTGTLVGAVAGGIIGNQVGSGTGRVLATAAGAFVGGVVGHSIGQRMDEHDRRLARQAEFAALERGQSGVATPWRNPDNGHYGEVVPRRSYKLGGRSCREYTHTVYIDGRPETMRGKACRNPDGTWKDVA